MAYKGRFKLKNPQKYMWGNPSNVIYRSSLELKFMRYCDGNSSVLQWASEELWVPYVDPTTGRYRRYFPDFVMKVKTRDGGQKTIMVEIKPFERTLPPKEPKKQEKKKNKRYLQEAKRYAINSYKWKSAREYCERRGWEFTIITERELGQGYKAGT